MFAFGRAGLIAVSCWALGLGFVEKRAVAGTAAPQYTLTDLGTLPGWPSALPGGVNKNGQVTGTDYSSMPYSTAFLYSGGTLTDLGTNGQVASNGTAINDEGQIVGYTTNASGVQHGYLYTNGTMVNLTSPTGPTSGASGINDAAGGGCLHHIIQSGSRGCVL